MRVLMHMLHWFWFQSQKDLKRGFEPLSSLKNRILVVLSLRGYLGLRASEKRSASSRT